MDVLGDGKRDKNAIHKQPPTGQDSTRETFQSLDTCRLVYHGHRRLKGTSRYNDPLFRHQYEAPTRLLWERRLKLVFIYHDEEMFLVVVDWNVPTCTLRFRAKLCTHERLHARSLASVCGPGSFCSFLTACSVSAVQPRTMGHSTRKTGSYCLDLSWSNPSHGVRMSRCLIFSRTVKPTRCSMREGSLCG